MDMQLTWEYIQKVKLFTSDIIFFFLKDHWWHNLQTELDHYRSELPAIIHLDARQ
jgi:hypothetical protein